MKILTSETNKSVILSKLPSNVNFNIKDSLLVMTEASLTRPSTLPLILLD